MTDKYILQNLERQKKTKAVAWDYIDKLFWDMGHTHLKEPKIIKLLLSPIKNGEKICVVGASTIYLIKELLKKNIQLTVIDFSEKMCDSLLNTLDSERLDVVVSDFLEFNGNRGSYFNRIFSDKVINCLDENQLLRFFLKSTQLLDSKGELICIVKVGLYEFDKKLLLYAKKNNLADYFYDAKNNVIDYRLVEGFIDKVFEKNFINKDTFINWYLNRGLEKRFSMRQINYFEKQYNLHQHGLHLVEKFKLDDYEDLVYLRFHKA